MAKTHLRRSKSNLGLPSACGCPARDHIRAVWTDQIGGVDCLNCKGTLFYKSIQKALEWVDRISPWEYPQKEENQK